MRSRKGRAALFECGASAIGALSTAGGVLAAGAIATAMMLVCFEVLMRYFLRSPTVWSVEVSTYMLLLSAWPAAAYGLKQGAHVKISMFVERFPRKTRLIIDAVTSVLSLGLLIICAWQGWLIVGQWMDRKLASYTQLAIPLFIPMFFIFLGICLFGLQYVVEIWSIVKQISSSSAAPEYKEAERAEL